jgi:hypothetical protein
MARSPRSEYLSPDDDAVVFAICRAARSPLVPSQDTSNPTHNARRLNFIKELIQFFTRYFCISVHAQAVLPGELRMVLRTHPGFTRTLDDLEIARRWLCLCPTLRRPKLRSVEPTTEEIVALSADHARIAQIRMHLSDVSWFLRLLQQRITWFCNREDNFKGHFWGDRFRSIVMLQRGFRLLAMANVDLCALNLDSSRPFTSSEFNFALQQLCNKFEAQQVSVPPQATPGLSASFESETIESPTTHPFADDPTPTLRSRCDSQSAAPESPFENTPTPFVLESDHYRCRDTAEYLELLKWIHRASCGDTGCPIPASLSQLLHEMQLTEDVSAALIRNFSVLFSHVAGRPEKMDTFITRSGRRRAWVTPEVRILFRRCEPQFPSPALS